MQTNKESTTIKERGKKRFQERVAEEREAEKEIKNYEYEVKDTLDNDDNHPTFP